MPHGPLDANGNPTHPNNQGIAALGTPGRIALGLGALGLGYKSYQDANYSLENAPPTGYQGDIPDYALVRENVLDTYNPERVPGSRGQRYFSDFAFLPRAYAEGVASADGLGTDVTVSRNEDIDTVRQSLFDQANVGPNSLRAQNYARTGILSPPEIGTRGPTGIDSVIGYPEERLGTTTVANTPEEEGEETGSGPNTSTEGFDITDDEKFQVFAGGNVYVPGYGMVNVEDDMALANFLFWRKNGSLPPEEAPPAGEGESPPAGEGEGESPPEEAPPEEAPPEEAPPPFGTRYDGEDFTADQFARFTRDEGDLNNDGSMSKNEWLNWMLNKGATSGTKADGTTYEADWNRRTAEALKVGGITQETLDLAIEKGVKLPFADEDRVEFLGLDADGNLRYAYTLDGVTNPPADAPGDRIAQGNKPNAIDQILRENPRGNANAQGGLISLMGGGYLGGSTDGMADMINGSIDNSQPAALSDGEFVVPADVVSHLGNGNSDAGADQLYSMMDQIRTDRTGTKKQGKQIDPNNYVPRGIV